MDLDRKWILVKNITLKSKKWDDEVVVYNTFSGDTYLYDEIGWKILSTIQIGPHSGNQLITEVFQMLADNHMDVNQVRSHVEKILADLYRNGLIESSNT